MHPRVEVFFTFKDSAHIKLLNNTYRAIILSDNSHFSLAAATVLHIRHEPTGSENQQLSDKIIALHCHKAHTR